MLTQYHQIGLF